MHAFKGIYYKNISISSKIEIERGETDCYKN